MYHLRTFFYVRFFQNYFSPCFSVSYFLVFFREKEEKRWNSYSHHLSSLLWVFFFSLLFLASNKKSWKHPLQKKKKKVQTWEGEPIFNNDFYSHFKFASLLTDFYISWTYYWLFSESTHQATNKPSKTIIKTRLKRQRLSFQYSISSPPFSFLFPCPLFVILILLVTIDVLSVVLHRRRRRRRRSILDDDGHGRS